MVRSVAAGVLDAGRTTPVRRSAVLLANLLVLVGTVARADDAPETRTPRLTGLGNLLIGYNEPRPVPFAGRGGSHNLVVGPLHDYGSFGGFVAGSENILVGPHSSVSGGVSNVASGPESSVSGGNVNTASGGGSSVCGGQFNTASGPNSSVSGGQLNTASGAYSSVSGGLQGEAPGEFDWTAGDALFSDQ